MYKYFISFRYLKTRLISLLSIVGVAVGVMVLIVVLSVMDGFKKEFKTRLQGSLSDILISVEDKDLNYQEVANKLRKAKGIKDFSPHLEGLVLIGTGKYYVGSRVMGIDYSEEKNVLKLEEYLVTPYKQKKLWVERILEENVRSPYYLKFSWEVIAAQNVPPAGEYPAGTRVICKKVIQYIPRDLVGYQREATRKTSYTAYIINEHNQVAFIEENLPEEYIKRVRIEHKLSPEGEQRWQGYFDKLAASLEKREGEKFLAFFSPKLREEDSLNPENPFEYRHSDKDSILVGYELMRQLGLQRGDELTLVTGQRAPEEDNKLKPISKKFIVVGAFRSGWQELDAHLCYTQREALLGFLDVETDVTEVCVLLNDPQQAQQVKRHLQELFNYGSSGQKVVVERWQERRKTFLAAIELERNVMALIMFLIVLLALVMITIVLVLLVTEKTKDIGILKSMGATSRGIMMIFLFNGFFITLMGTLIGGVAGVWITVEINAIADTVYELTGFRVFPRDVYYLDQIPTDLSAANVAGIILPTWLLSLAACSIPARRAAQMDAVKALSSEFYIAGNIKSFFSFFRGLSRSEERDGSERVRKGFFEAVNLYHHYTMGEQQLRILEGIDLSIQRGEILLIIGNSGEGKSTLLHLLGLLDTPTQGDIYHEGIRLNSLSPARQCRKRNQEMGFIFQFYHLLPEFTALENVYLGAMIRPDWNKIKQQKITQAKELLTQVGLAERMEHRPLQLSGGERQRVAIARALINEPQILFCDEPTGNLDEENSKAIQHLLWNLNEKTGQTLVIVSHDISLAKHAHRVFRLKGGKLHQEDIDSL